MTLHRAELRQDRGRLASENPRGTLRPEVSDRDHDTGPAGAPVTLVEYGDYECPYCRHAHPIVRAIRKEVGDTMRFVFRNFPIAEIHPHAVHAAEAAESVGFHAGAEAYWSMHDAIFEHQNDSPDALDDAHLLVYAASVGADPLLVKRDLDEERFVDRVAANSRSGVRSGVKGTPTFFINGARFEGDWTDRRKLLAAIEEAHYAAEMQRAAGNPSAIVQGNGNQADGFVISDPAL